MPLYEYQCTRCQRRIEKIQSFTAPPLTVCEACGGLLERLISASAIQFKGSGWYATDYAHKSGSSPASESSESKKPAEAKPAEPAKTESGSGAAQPAPASTPAASSTK